MVWHFRARVYHGSSYDLVELDLPGCGDTCCYISFKVPWNCVCWDGVKQ